MRDEGRLTSRTGISVLVVPLRTSSLRVTELMDCFRISSAAPAAGADDVGSCCAEGPDDACGAALCSGVAIAPMIGGGVASSNVMTLPSLLLLLMCASRSRPAAAVACAALCACWLRGATSLNLRRGLIGFTMSLSPSPRAALVQVPMAVEARECAERGGRGRSAAQRAGANAEKSDAARDARGGGGAMCAEARVTVTRGGAE